MQLQAVTQAEIEQFRRVVEAYWEEIMPTADVLESAQRRAAYFERTFAWQDAQPAPHWAMVEGRPVGFVHYTLAPEERRAMIENFYVLPDQRRHGYGTAIVQALCRELDSLGVELVELNVRRDTPHALAFWEAQGFRIALFRMRQYRDPVRGHAFVGALSSDFDPGQ